MDYPQYVDNYLREPLDCSLSRKLESKIRLSEETQRQIRDQCFDIKIKLMEKDRAIEFIRAESRMKEQALEKSKEENGRLINVRVDLMTRCTKWEDECSSYVSKLEALNDTKNQADERAIQAESRVRYLEDETRKLSEELQSFKQQSEMECTENILVDALISTLINKDEVASTSHSFLETNSKFEACQKLLKIWDGLNPSTVNVLALASEVKNLQKHKDILRNNLIIAEKKVSVLFDKNDEADTENKKLIDHVDSRGSAVEKKIGFNDAAT